MAPRRSTRLAVADDAPGRSSEPPPPATSPVLALRGSAGGMAPSGWHSAGTTVHRCGPLPHVSWHGRALARLERAGPPPLAHPHIARPLDAGGRRRDYLALGTQAVHHVRPQADSPFASGWPLPPDRGAGARPRRLVVRDLSLQRPQTADGRVCSGLRHPSCWRVVQPRPSSPSSLAPPSLPTTPRRALAGDPIGVVATSLRGFALRAHRDQPYRCVAVSRFLRRARVRVTRPSEWPPLRPHDAPSGDPSRW
jgi:hypothetical protein